MSHKSWLSKVLQQVFSSSHRRRRRGKAASLNQSWQVRNLAVERLEDRAVPSTNPVLTAPPTQTINEGTRNINLGSFSDADGSQWRVDINWGDTHAESFTTTSQGALSRSHNFDGAAVTTNYNVSVTVTDISE